MDLLDEKSGMLSKAGSFYYRNITQADRLTAQRLTHVSCLSRAARQMENASNAVLSGGYFPDNYKVIRFTDAQVLYYGLEEALQKRVVIHTPSEAGVSRTDQLVIPNSFEPADSTDNGLAVGNEHLIAPGGTDDVVMGDNTLLTFGLSIDPDIYVTSIELDNGELLAAGYDFESQYGLMKFSTNPIQLFNGMKFMARSYVQRKRNLYSYTLQLDDVYGPVDRVMEYYRKNQSVRALYYAAAQASGMPVVREDCKVLGVMPLHSGNAYQTTSGRYDAPFYHTALTVGTELHRNDVIGADDIFKLYGPNDLTPELLTNLPAINLDTVLPVKGLSAPNSTGQLYIGDAFRPAYTGSSAALDSYYEYIHRVSNDDPTGDIRSGNLLANMLTEVLANKFILVRIKEDNITAEMKLRLLTFLDRERPLGSVLLFAPM